MISNITSLTEQPVCILLLESSGPGWTSLCRSASWRVLGSRSWAARQTHRSCAWGSWEERPGRRLPWCPPWPEPPADLRTRMVGGGSRGWSQTRSCWTPPACWWTGRGNTWGREPGWVVANISEPAAVDNINIQTTQCRTVLLSDGWKTLIR